MAVELNLDTGLSLSLNPNLTSVPHRKEGRIERIDLWVPVRGRALRFWQLSATHHEHAFRLLVETLEGGVDPLRLPQSDVSVLARYGILVAPEEVSRRPAFEWTDLPPRSAAGAVRAAEQFEMIGYATFETGLTGPQLSQLGTYYRDLAYQGWMGLGDQLSRRYWAQNDPAGRALQQWLLPVVTEVVRADIKPSFTLAIRYVRGADLPQHVDRAQSHYAVTLLVDFDGLPHGELSWPLQLHIDEGRTVPVYQRRGDAALFHGGQLPHSRPRLECEFSMSVLLFYVDASFDGPLD